MPDNAPLPDLGDLKSIPLAGHVNLTVKSGLPLESGLRALAEQSRSRQSRYALMELANQLEQGMPLADALRISDVMLPAPMKALVQAGMETGQLNTVMQHSIEQSQRSISLRQQILLSLSYPAFLIWFSTLISSAILVFIVPMTADLLKGMDVFGMGNGTLRFTDVTDVLLNFSSVVSVFGGWTWVAISLTGISLIGVVLWIGLSGWGQRRLTSIPLVGGVFRFAALSEFCRILAILVESQLPFPKAIRAAGCASDDYWLRIQCQRMAIAIENGSTPEEAASSAELPSTLAQVFRSANAERSLIEALRGLSDIYVSQCFVYSKLVATIVEPIAILTVVFTASATIVVIFVPVIELLNALA